MIQVVVLEASDIVLATDYCRPLSLSSGYDDGYSFTSMYSGRPINNVKWTRVEQVFGPVWFNKSVETLNEALGLHEFIRGKLPETHLYGKTKEEQAAEYDEYLKSNVFPYGKHKELTFYEVRYRFPDYFNWAISKGIIKDEIY
jgi:hypothetical protein